jgi:hypothetical protein
MTKLPAYIKSLLSKDEVDQVWTKLQELMSAMPKDPVFDETNNDINVPQGVRFGKIINANMGKIYFNLSPDFFTESILNKLTAIAEEIEPGVTFQSATYTEYSSQYGKPTLGVHQDRFDIFLLIDLQINSNTTWELSADGADYKLEDGDAIALHAGSTDHGRPHKDFKDGEVVSMIFLDFLRPGTIND